MLGCSEWSRTHDVLGFLHTGGWLLWYDQSQCKLNARLYALLLLKFNIGQRITSKFQGIKVDIVMLVFSQMLLHLLILLFFLWTWRLDSQLGKVEDVEFPYRGSSSLLPKIIIYAQRCKKQWTWWSGRPIRSVVQIKPLQIEISNWLLQNVRFYMIVYRGQWTQKRVLVLVQIRPSQMQIRI